MRVRSIVLVLLASLASAPSALADPWPGSSTVTTVDETATFGTNTSGLDYEAINGANPGVLWVVNNTAGTLYRMEWNVVSSTWVNDTDNGWSSGKVLRHTDGTSQIDSEGVTLVNGSSAGGVYVSSERLNDGNTSRPAVLRYDVTPAATTLTAAQEWDLTAQLPAAGANRGVESVTWIPDADLVAGGFVDESTGAAYDPADYDAHSGGVFVVGLEENANVYAFVLEDDGTITLIATISGGLTRFGALNYDAEYDQLWVVGDNNSQGRTRVFAIEQAAGATKGKFTQLREFDRPTGMGNFNNEGFTIAPEAECAGGFRPVYWADDDDDDGHALRRGTIPCGAVQPPAVAAPTCPDRTESTPHGASKQATLSCTPGAGGALSYAIVAPPPAEQGTASINGDQLVYSPPSPTFVGTATFTYKATEGGVDSAAATVTVNVTNAPPTCAPVSAQTTAPGVAKDVGVFCSSTDGDPLSASGTAEHGTVVGTVNGVGAVNIRYTPNAGYVGPDTVTFVANDGVVDSAPQTIAFTVGASPQPSATPSPTPTVTPAPVPAVVLPKSLKARRNKTVTVAVSGLLAGTKLTIGLGKAAKARSATAVAGRATRVKLTLAKGARRTLGRKGSLKVTIGARAVTADGQTRTASKRVTLKGRKARKKRG